MIKRMKIVYICTAILLITLMVLCFSGEKGFFDLKLLNQERESMIEKNRLLARENMKLFYEIQHLKNDPDYIEDVARRELGMVAGDEIILKFGENGMKEH